MRRVLALLACGTVLCLGMAIASNPAEARKPGVGADHGIGHAGRTARAIRSGVNQRHIAHRDIGHPPHKHGRDRIIWRTLTPAIAGGACAFEYRRWRQTGSADWRNRYYACVH
jgi:hypothetical protein